MSNYSVLQDLVTREGGARPSYLKLALSVAFSKACGFEINQRMFGSWKEKEYASLLDTRRGSRFILENLRAHLYGTTEGISRDEVLADYLLNSRESISGPQGYDKVATLFFGGNKMKAWKPMSELCRRHGLTMQTLGWGHFEVGFVGENKFREDKPRRNPREPALSRKAIAILQKRAKSISATNLGELTVDDLPALDNCMKGPMHTAAMAARTTDAVLILGETGSGKSAFAHVIHNSGTRRDAPFLAINFANLSPEIVESQLFGHKRGAFTGAINEHNGLIRACKGGTLLLDDLSASTPAVQAKLLQVVDEQKAMAVGDTKPYVVDVRFIFTLNEGPQALIDAGRLRSDLYWRISQQVIDLPPIRMRPTELSAIALDRLVCRSKELGVPTPSLTPLALRELRRHGWPGNFRELGAVINRLVDMQVRRINTGHVRLAIGLPNEEKIVPFGEASLPAAPGLRLVKGGDKISE